MELYTKWLLIRDFVAEDADSLLVILGDADVMHFLEPSYSIEQTIRF
jgi:hypothetical protein